MMFLSSSLNDFRSWTSFLTGKAATHQASRTEQVETGKKGRQAKKKDENIRGTGPCFLVGCGVQI